MHHGWIVGVVCALGVLIAGCRGNTPHPENTSGQTPEQSHLADYPQSAERLAMGGMSPLAGATQPGAAGAVETALEGFRTGHLEIAFDFLPASYQQDVNSLVHEFAHRVNPEIWRLSIAVLDKGNKVLRMKKAILLPLFPPSEREVLSTAWDDFTSSADQTLHNRLDDLGEMQRVDVRDWLRTDVGRTVRRLMTLSALANPGAPSPLTPLSQVQVDLVESSDTTARVRISPPGLTDVEPTDFVNIEGKWIPRSLAEGWSPGLTTARQFFHTWTNSTQGPETERLRGLLKVCDDILDEMLAAETPEQMATATKPLFAQATQLTQQIATPLPAVPEGPPEGVSLLIQRELSDDELTKLLSTLEALTDDPEREYHLATANGGKTYISIKPVHDVAAFAAKLTFGQDPTIDLQARTITVRDVEMKSPPQ